jgi:hypothetical protein
MSIGDTVVNRNLDPLDGARFQGVSPGDTYWNLDRILPSRSRLTTRHDRRRPSHPAIVMRNEQRPAAG